MSHSIKMLYVMEGKVSIWLGNFDSEQSLEDYIELVYSDEVATSQFIED